MTETIRLHAADLWSKWGFGDGDMLIDVTADDIAFSNGQHELLERLVRAYLLPLLPGVKVEIWGTCHNPIRATDFAYQSHAPASVNGIFIDVSYDQIRELMV